MIGTGAALAMAALGSLGASTYATKSAGAQNRRSQDYQREADTRAATMEAERLAEEKRLADEKIVLERENRARQDRQYQDALQRDRERWADYVRVNQPHWQTGSNALAGLYELAGFQGGVPAGGDPAAMVATAGPPPPTAPVPGEGGTSGPREFPPYGQQPDVIRAAARVGSRPRGLTTAPPRTSALSIDQLMQLASLAKPSTPTAPPPGSLTALATMSRL